jgi:hypothetical protein
VQKRGQLGIVDACPGGPYLPQATIDVIRQWITNGAAELTASRRLVAFRLAATSHRTRP